jgi:hypothetical protein
MKELWRLLLPGMDVPACGVADEAIATSEGDAAGQPVETGAPAQADQPNDSSIFLRVLAKIRS